MGYVLVPVPTEFVLDVMRWVIFRAPSDDEHDAVRLTHMLAEADEATRSLLLAVATATAKDENLRLRDLADRLGRDAEEVRAAVKTLNQEVLDEGRPIVELRNETSVGVHGQTGTSVFVSMRSDLVRIVRASVRGPKGDAG